MMFLLAAALLFGQSEKKAPTELRAVTIPMRDGVKLVADITVPRDVGRFATVLIRTPYSRRSPNVVGYHYFVQHGYALVIEDLRGRGSSQGTFSALPQEGADANDTINWIAQQPWSDGRVVMAGSSYLGLVQWWAALENNPHLKAISPMYSGDDEYTDRYYSEGGALKLGHRLLWFTENFPPAEPTPIGSYLNHLPVRTSDMAATGTVLPLWRMAVDHPSFDAFWERQSVREMISRIHTPVLSFGGWFDNYAASDLDAFGRLAKARQTIETWIGPWAHNPALTFPTLNFGPEARLPIRAKQMEWYDHWLRRPTPAEGAATLHLFVMGPNVWREEHEWPLARTHYTPLYLSSSGHANTVDGDGGLNWQLPRKAKADNFTYDPKNPAPTMGGSICCEPTVFPPGPLNQTSVEARPDVLIYTSPPLAEEIEVTGPVRTVLYVATSANDTDFTAKLVDVQPDGKPLLVTDGIQRLRYRLSLKTPVFVKRYQAYQISVDTGVTSYVFAPKHRIRLEVSSSNFPRFDRILNSTGLNADQTKIVKARQTVFHEKGYPSAIILPVIGKTHLSARAGN